MNFLNRVHRWRTAALGGLLLMTGVGVCGAQSITGPVGATNAANYIYDFMTASDGNMWLRTNYPGAVQWENRGTPAPGVGIASALGAMSISGNPYEYVVGTDGNLYMNHGGSGGWVWSNHGTPPGVSISMAIGSTTDGGTYAYAFVVGSDGNAWMHDGGSWYLVGRPNNGAVITKGLGVTTLAYPRGRGQITLIANFIYLLDSAGNVWQAAWNADCTNPRGTGYIWSNAGPPASGGIVAGGGAIAAQVSWPPPGGDLCNSNFGVFPFLIGSAGNLWLLNGWTNLGNPAPGVTVAKALGLVNSANGQFPLHGYVIGSDGHLYRIATAKSVTSSWTWTDLGLAPNGLAFNIPIGVILNPWAFATDTGGELWGWNDTAGTYSDMGIP
jgi:hypothetical protein